MRAVRGRSAGAVAAAVGLLLVVLAGCAPEKNVEVENLSDTDVTVHLGDETGEALGTGGFALLGVTECYGPPLILEYRDGPARELGEEICPGDRLVITGGDVRLVREAERVTEHD